MAHACSSEMRIKILFVLLPFMVFDISNARRKAVAAPAMFVFGDSLADVGNNNYIKLSFLKANYAPNGVDFPGHKATGRFSNGKNAADFIAEKLGQSSPLPYLFLARNNESANFLNGASFASGGAGIFDHTSKRLRIQGAIPMNTQIRYYAKVQIQLEQKLGKSSARALSAKSPFVIVIGNNDLLDYFHSYFSTQDSYSGSTTNKRTMTPQVLVDSMLGNITQQIQQIYDLGGRNFYVVGIGPLGCCPGIRLRDAARECDAESNGWSHQYNQRLLSVLVRFRSKLKGFQYNFIDTYNIVLNIIKNHAAYGFKEAVTACCGKGYLRGRLPCLPKSPICRNRSEYIFWDVFHPTEATDRLIVKAALRGT